MIVVVVLAALESSALAIGHPVPVRAIPVGRPEVVIVCDSGVGMPGTRYDPLLTRSDEMCSAAPVRVVGQFGYAEDSREEFFPSRPSLGKISTDAPGHW